MGRKRLFNDKEKWCNKCSKWLPLDAFGENRRTVSGKQDYCKTCHQAYAPNFWGKIAGYDQKLINEYGITPGEYLELWKHQGQKCKICRCSISLYERGTALDHDHATGKVRGLLCALCNTALGSFRDAPVILQSAIAYLESAAQETETFLLKLRSGPEQMSLGLSGHSLAGS